MVITIHILATDDERLALKSLMNALEQVFPQAEICGFQKSQEALDYAERLCSENKISLDFAFLDVEMPEMTGIELAAKLKKICPEVCIFFVTGFTNYAYDAYRLHAKGYILKPVSAELIKEDLANLKKLPTFEMPSIRSRKSVFTSEPSAPLTSLWIKSRWSFPGHVLRSFWPIWWIAEAAAFLSQTSARFYLKTNPESEPIKNMLKTLSQVSSKVLKKLVSAIF